MSVVCKSLRSRLLRGQWMAAWKQRSKGSAYCRNINSKGLSAEKHLRGTEDSFQVKRPITIFVVAKEERTRSYSAAQVLNTAKGVNGSGQLELAGGGSLTRLVDPIA